jgi:uncharacterized protein YjbI with pentapeptide repeats
MLILERDTKDIDALLVALNRSAERLQTLWFSFLALTLYFIIIALTTTHRMLLLEEAQALPIINLKVPLLPFYVIAPIFYLVLHFYVLMMLVLLARSSAVFEDALVRTLPATADREQFRMRAENTLFLQLLIGARPEREGFNSKLLALIALITLAVAPVVTLIVTQMQFLPYHHFEITWLHRAIVLADVVMVFLLWRGYRLRKGRALPYGPFTGWRNRRPYWTWHASASVAGIVAALLLTLYEGRWAGEPWIDPVAREHPRLIIPRLFADRLSLRNETIVGEALLLEKQKEAASGGGNRWVPTRDFRGRNFAYANFSSADLRGVTFAPDAQNERASVLRSANLSRAQMQGVDLESANMKGSDLNEARIQGASLAGAQIQGANLANAQMQGADLAGSQMQGANLADTRMQGANLADAQLQGTSLHNAQMQGANLTFAQMHGTILVGAQMQGANLSYAKMQGAELLGSHLFRTTTNRSTITEAWFGDLKIGLTSLADGQITRLFTDTDVEGWLAEGTASIASNLRKRITTARFIRLKGDITDTDKSSAAKWQALEASTKTRDPDGKQHRVALAALYGDLACEDDDDDGPYLARGLIKQMFSLGDARNAFRERLVAARLAPATCPGVTKFTETDWKSLDNQPFTATVLPAAAN